LAEKIEHQRDKSRVDEKDDRPKSKQELFQLRKEMMKSKHTRSKSEFGGRILETQNTQTTQNTIHNMNSDRSKSPMGTRSGFNPFDVDKKNKKEPNPELLERLAFGKKSKVPLSWYKIMYIRLKRRR
jgi:hypothetical protein